jgi:hypothetical protein
VCRFDTDKDRHRVFFIRISAIPSLTSTSALAKGIVSRR